MAALIVDRRDSAATAVADLAPGSAIRATAPTPADDVEVTPNEAIAYGHERALVDIPAGADIVDYGDVIGLATVAIARGGHVHDVASRRGRGRGAAGR